MELFKAINAQRQMVRDFEMSTNFFDIVFFLLKPKFTQILSVNINLGFQL